MLNNINNTNPSRNVQFCALKLNKPFEKWNDDVLVATLKSRAIRSIISNDAKAGRDTFLSFNTKVTSSGKTDPITDTMTLTVNEGENALHFEASTVRTPVKNGLLGKYEYIITGAQNLGQSIAAQIRALDKENFSRKNAINEITDIAGNIVVNA